MKICVVDKLTGADNLASLQSVAASPPPYSFMKADSCSAAALRKASARARPDIVAHLAAEGRVDRSIGAPGGISKAGRARLSAAPAPAPECLGAWPEPALDGVMYVRYVFFIAPNGALRLDIVDNYC